MTQADAKKVLQSWLTANQDALEAALEALISKEWLNKHPELFIHPRQTIDERTLGLHQSWDCNLMPYREITCGNRTVYVFDFHINELLD